MLIFRGILKHGRKTNCEKWNRREEILQSLALMLESSDGSQRITTAKLAASVGVPKRRYTVIFPVKTRMFDSLHQSSLKTV